eukprot:15340837-Ditylum_brightwellii.AAC.1
MKHFDTVDKRYNWWATGPVVQANIDLAFETMSRFLSDELLETWEDKCAVRATKNKANFDKNSDILTKFICGEDAYDAQVNYLKYTKKPEDMTMLQWLKRIKVNNRMLPCLKPSGKQLMIKELNKYVILENIPGKMAVSYIGQGGKRFTKKDEIKTILEELEEAHKLDKKLNALQENKQLQFQKKGNNDGKKGGNDTNKKAKAGSNAHKKGGGPKTASDDCCLPNHKHKWKDCENNPSSESYKRTHYRDIWARHNAKEKGKELHLTEKVKRGESNDNKEYMMTLKDSTINLDTTDIESNSKPEEDAKDATIRHPETIITMPVAPGSKKIKTMPCLLDMCATGSLMDPKFFNKILGDYKDTKAFTIWKQESVGHRQQSFHVEGQSDNQQHVPTKVEIILTKSSWGWQTCTGSRCTLILKRTWSSGWASTYPWTSVDFGSSTRSTHSGASQQIHGAGPGTGSPGGEVQALDQRTMRQGAWVAQETRAVVPRETKRVAQQSGDITIEARGQAVHGKAVSRSPPTKLSPEEADAAEWAFLMFFVPKKDK